MTPDQEVIIEMLKKVIESMADIRADFDALNLRLGDIDDELNAYSPTSCFDEIGD